MSSGHAKQRVRSRFAAKVESVAGTAVSLALADGAMILMDGSIDYDIPLTQRQKPGSMSQLTGTPQARKANIKVTAEMMGFGSSGVPLWASTFLAASGFALTSQTYAPVSGSSSATTLTCGVYRDGRLRQAAGCAFDWTMKLDNGMPGYIDFTGQGAYVAPTDVALISPTFPTVIPPVVLGITATFGGTAYAIPSIEIAGGNQLYLRQVCNTGTTGYLNTEITNRLLTVTITPEALAIATRDSVGDFLLGTEVALSIILGSVTNNIITIAAPKLQLQSAPNEGDRNGIVTENLVYQANATGGTDDSEFSIAFS